MDTAVLDLPGDIDTSSDAADTDSGLVRWWLCFPSRMGGTRWYDMIDGSVGTLTAMALNPTATSGWGFGSRPGGYGELRFDGVDDYVTIADSAIMEMGSSDYTISLWMYKSDITTYGLFFYHFTPTGDQRSFAFRTDNASNRQLLLITSGNGIDSKVLTSSSNVWSANKHEHIVVTKSGTVGTFYVNGAVVGDDATALDATIFDGTGDFRIGATNDSSVFSLITIDDLRIYNRKLSAQEVAVLYERSRSGYQNLFEDSMLDYVQAAAVAGTSILRQMMQHDHFRGGILP